jgi:hypothetical protein
MVVARTPRRDASLCCRQSSEGAVILEQRVRPIAMNSGLCNALVYIGLAKPTPRGGAEVPTAPMNISRVVALAVALCLGVGLALAVLWLTGLVDADLVWGALLVAVLGTIAPVVWERSERRYRCRKTSD